MPYKNEEERREYHRRYREAHREKANAYGVEYRKAHPEAIKAKNKHWQEARQPIVDEARRLREYPSLVECQICHRHFASLLGKHLAKHGLSIAEYRTQFPDAPMMIAAMSESRSKGGLIQALRNAYDGQAPDSKLFSFLLGAMLGDGSLECPKRNARYVDASSNEAYATWKHALLKAYFPTTITKRVSQPHKKTGREYTAWFVRTASHPLLTEWHTAWYPDHKRVSRDLVLKHLDSFALAVWFFDDGHHGRSGLFLYTLGFEVSDVEWLAGLLSARFCLEAIAWQNNRGQAMIRIPASSIERFLDLVRPHVAPGMDYKIMGRK